jgi:hypothetical protein
MQLRFHFVLVVLAALLLLASPALAQEAGEAPVPEGGPEVMGQVQEPEADMATEAIEDLPAPTETGRSWPVFVVHQGDDPLGARLALRLKETFNGSNLFSLTEEDQRKIKVLLTTREEFPGRARLGSIYSATWIYQASETMLAHHLAGELGFIAPDGLDSLAEELAARTETMATRYSYLFE